MPLPLCSYPVHSLLVTLESAVVDDGRWPALGIYCDVEVDVKFEIVVRAARGEADIDLVRFDHREWPVRLARVLVGVLRLVEDASQGRRRLHALKIEIEFGVHVSVVAHGGVRSHVDVPGYH